jgi:hypothetical protein
MLLLLLVACRDRTPPGSGSFEPTDPPVPDTTPSDPSPVDTDTGPAESALEVLEVGLGLGGNGCALLSDRSVRCWGDEIWMEEVPSPSASFVQLATRSWEKCAIRDDGRVECWCRGHYTDICNHVPTGSFVRVETSGSLGCAQAADGILTCWDGQPNQPNPVRDRAPAEPVADFDLDGEIGCALRLDGSPLCWGGTQLFSPYWEVDETGYFGLGEAPPLDLTYTDIAVGTRSGCALDTEAELHCWGTSAQGIEFPDAPPGPWASVRASGDQTCGLRPDGAVECWGIIPDYDPVIEIQVEVPPDPLRFVTIGGDDACGITTDGQLVCWGVDSDGYLADLPTW